jgi:hypothetical protein
MDYKTGPRGWILWPGVALMVSEALTAVAFSWKSFLKILKSSEQPGRDTFPEEDLIPNSWWIGGLILGSMLTGYIAWNCFEIPWYLALLAIALSALLSAVATRSLGETDINPIGGMGKVTQLVFGFLHPGNLASNLMAAGITKSYVPSGLAMGIAFIIPAYYSLVIFYGMVAWWVWTKIAPTSSDKFTFTVASGLIAGEGLMGIANAGLTLLGIG